MSFTEENYENIPLAMVLAAIATVAIYYAMIFSVEVSYFFAYKIKQPTRWNMDFGRSLWLFYDYILPYVLIITDLIVLLVKNKTAYRIAVVLVFLAGVIGYLGPAWLSYWPYRLIPALSVITIFYFLNVLIVRFIAQKILYRARKEDEDDVL